MQHRAQRVIGLEIRTGRGSYVLLPVCTELHVDKYLPHVVRICCCFRPHCKSRVSTPVDADALKYKYPVTLMVILCVSSSRLTTSLVKLHANMARILPTRPTRRGIHSKNTKRMLLCVSSHLERLRGAEMLMGRPLIVCAEPRTLAREQAKGR